MPARPKIAVAFAVAAVALAAAGASGQSPRARGPLVTVSSRFEGRPVRAGFVGLSMEYPAVEEYAGSDPRHPNPVLVALIRALAPGQSPILRIGGNTTDWAWVPAIRRTWPPWGKFALTAGWLRVAGALVRSLHAQVIPSLNLEANQPVLASVEARNLVRSFGRKRLVGFEIGNEPELYSSFSWYRSATGHGVRGRPAGYDFAAFLQDYAAVAAALPGLPLAGPSTGDAPAWSRNLAAFLRREPRIRVVTEHRYGLDHCAPSDPLPTIQRLTSSVAQLGVAQSVAGPLRTARTHHVPLRIEELNAVACGGWPGVSNSFGSALWALDTLFESVRVGVDGVNIHTRTNGVNSLFTTRLVNGRWTAGVKPEYYGLLMFAEAMPPGSRLLATTGAPRNPSVHVWAARLPHGGLRVTLIDEDPQQGGSVAIRLPSPARSGSLVRLSAASLIATSGVTLGSRDFGAASTTGVLPAPQPVTVHATRGSFVIELPAASAATLTAAGR